MSLVEALTAAAAALVATAAAAAILWKIVKPHVVALIEEVLDEVQAAKGHAEEASKQLHPNSGRSVADKVDKLGRQVATIVSERAVDRVELEAIKQGVSYSGRLLDHLDRDVQKVDRRLADHLNGLEQ